MQALFQNQNALANPVFTKSYPAKHALAHAGINAWYVAQLIDQQDLKGFLDSVNAGFESIGSRPFNSATVVQCKSKTDDSTLLYLTMNEFGGTVIKLVTDSVSFLNAIAHDNFPVPPPWIAFEGYNPGWWLGNCKVHKATTTIIISMIFSDRSILRSEQNIIQNIKLPKNGVVDSISIMATKTRLFNQGYYEFQ